MNKQTKAAAISLGKLAGAAAAFAGVKIFTSIIKATIEQEKALAQLNAVLESTGGAAGRTADDMVELAKSIQADTRGKLRQDCRVYP